MIDDATITLTVKKLKILIRQNTDENLQKLDDSVNDLINKAQLVCATLDNYWYDPCHKSNDTVEDSIKALKESLTNVRYNS